MFEQVIGQHDVQQRLMQLVSEERLPHALMLCGPQGCGKKALAIGFAKVLLTANGQKPSAMVDKLEHPDLHFTYPTIKLPSMGADHKPVSDDFAAQWHDMVMGGYYFNMTDWLEQMGGENQQAIITAGESDALIRKLSLKSSQGGYKVSIIWLPERMNIECANKILKLLEEPPSQTVFIMVCEEPEKLLETIRSRVQRIDVKRIDTDSICQALKEKRGLSDDMAQRISRMANGSWRQAMELLTADTENELFLDLFQALMRLAYQRKIKELRCSASAFRPTSCDSSARTSCTTSKRGTFATCHNGKKSLHATSHASSTRPTSCLLPNWPTVPSVISGRTPMPR